MTKNKLIVALDFPTLADAQRCVLACGDEVTYYKVGMELYYSAGNEMIAFLKQHQNYLHFLIQHKFYPIYFHMNLE